MIVRKRLLPEIQRKAREFEAVALINNDFDKALDNLLDILGDYFELDSPEDRVKSVARMRIIENAS